MNTYDLKDIAKSGGSISIDASNMTAYDLKDIAKHLTQNAILIIRNADSLTTY